jgi:hypothetical protein
MSYVMAIRSGVLRLRVTDGQTGMTKQIYAFLKLRRKHSYKLFTFNTFVSYTEHTENVRYEIFTAVRIIMFWVLASCRLAGR